MNLNEFKIKIDGLKSQIDSLSGQKDLLTSQLNTANSAIKSLAEKKITNLKAVEVLDIAQNSIRGLIKNSFESVVTSGLRSIYGDKFSFELDFGRRGNLMEAYFLIKNTHLQQAHDIKNTNAGGELDIISLGLRTVVLELFQKNNKAPLILDEPFKHVASVEYLEASGQFLKSLNSKMNRQIIMIAHEPELYPYVDNLIDVETLTK